MLPKKNPRGRRRKADTSPPPEMPAKRQPTKKATPPRRGRKPKTSPPHVEFEPLNVTSHRAFATAKVQNEIFSRFNASPELARLLLVNPVQAMKEVGVTLSTRLQKHVLHTLQYSTRMDAERKALDERIRTEIGRKPRPNDPAWVAEFLFGQLQLKPFDTRGQTPKYTSPFDADMLRVYEKLRPKRHRPDTAPTAQTGQTSPAGQYEARQVAQTARKSKAKPAPEQPPKPPQSPQPPQSATTGGASTITLGMPRTAIARLDLDAPLPELSYARKAPREVDLETLYFYKDSHPIVRDLIRLGIIERRQFPIQSADAFRKILRGERTSPFQRWIGDVRFPIVEDGDEPDR